MKIAVLLYQNMKHAPFLKFYERIFRERADVQYDVIYLDRHPVLMEENDLRHIPIPWVGRDDHHFLSKVLTALCYPGRAKRMLESGCYDFIFVLTTMPGVLLSWYLTKKYARRFILDIRDYTLEHVKAYAWAEQRLVKASALNVVSSPDYAAFLPGAEYVLCHNLNLPTGMAQPASFATTGNARIRISYVGNIQYAAYCIKMIRLVAADDRFEFYFHGAEGGAMEVTNFAAGMNCPRIRMCGRFEPDEKKDIFMQSSLIFNCYGSEQRTVRYAISNKLYDAALYRRPLLVSPNTTMARLSEGFSYAFDFDKENDLDGLFHWLKQMDVLAFEQYCSKTIEAAMRENQQLAERIGKMLQTQ